MQMGTRIAAAIVFVLPIVLMAFGGLALPSFGRANRSRP
jgi:hypothetical protein